MKILFATQYYPPESNAPAVRFSEMAIRWAAAGHDVTILTAFPHHPTGVIPPEYRGLKFLREERDGVLVTRTWVYVAPNKGVLKRSLSYISWMLSAIILGSSRTKRPDVVAATSPQILGALAGLAVAKAKRVPFVLDLRDLWPDSILAVGAMKEGTAISILRGIERFLYRSADAIVIVSPAFRAHLHRHGISDRRIHFVPNGVDLRRFSPGPASRDLYAENAISGRFRILYSGTVGMAHALELLVEAAERFRDEPEVEFVIVGEGARRTELLQEVVRRNLTNVHFIGIRPRDEMPDWIRGASAVVVHLRKTELFEAVLPSKLFEYMGCGKAVLMGVGGIAGEIVREADCGWSFTPESVDEFVELIRRVRADDAELQQKGISGRTYVERHYDRETLAQKYIDEVFTPLAKN